MSKSKEELEAKIHQLEDGLNRLLLENRVQWLRQVIDEAKLFGFSSFGELIGFIVDHQREVIECKK